MSDKMTLFVVKTTQHVVGATTLTAKSDPVVGSAGMLIRMPRKDPPLAPPKFEQLEVAAEELEPVSADFDLAVLMEPREYVFDKDLGAAIQPPSLPSTTADLKANYVEVDITDPATEEHDVWVQVTGANLSAPRVSVGKILVGSSACQVTLQTLEKGSYVLLALVARRPLILQAEDIP